MNVVQELRLCHKKSSRFRAKQGSRKQENAVIDTSDKPVEKRKRMIPILCGVIGVLIIAVIVIIIVTVTSRKSNNDENNAKNDLETAVTSETADETVKSTEATTQANNWKNSI